VGRLPERSEDGRPGLVANQGEGVFGVGVVGRRALRVVLSHTSPYRIHVEKTGAGTADRRRSD